MTINARQPIVRFTTKYLVRRVTDSAYYSSPTRNENKERSPWTERLDRADRWLTPESINYNMNRLGIDKSEYVIQKVKEQE